MALDRRYSTALLGTATLVLAGTLSSRGSGVASGVSSIPANASRQLASCSACHSGSAPSATRTGGPNVALTVANRVLQQGQSVAVTTAATGGVTGTTGGFLCEATAGSFTAGSNNHVNTGNLSVTHNNNSSRSWSYTYVAPNTVGLVELTSVAITTNGSGSSGDRFSFSGYDANATVATPARLFVLPTGVSSLGAGCPDGYGNYSVLGATSVPTLGNLGFGFQVAGATPGSAAIIYYGINPPGFAGLDLGALLGVTGCTAWLVNPLMDNMAFTSAGAPERAEGTCAFTLSIPNDQALAGLGFDAQAAYFDPSATFRSMQISLTNGLHMVVQ